MDTLARLLDGPCGRDAYLLRVSMSPPWSMRLEDGASLGLIAILEGSAWIDTGHGPPFELAPGDVLVAQGPDPATLSHEPGEPPHVHVVPGLRCVDRDGRDLGEEMTLGTRAWGNDPHGSTIMLIGCYQLRGEVSQRLLGGLPRLLWMPAAALDSPLLPILASEITRDEPGQSAILDRLFDVLLVDVLRAWHARQDDPDAGWHGAQGDRIVGRVLRQLHENPTHPWTIAELAASVNLSRAALAKRFSDRVGEPPMAYLTGWRLALAADRLRDPGTTLDAIAREVGYSSSFALSAAFKRERGMSPSDYRALHTSSPSTSRASERVADAERAPVASGRQADASAGVRRIHEASVT